jgi:hypothetical protein
MTAIGTSLITLPFSFPRPLTCPILRTDADLDATWLVPTVPSGELPQQLPQTVELRSGRQLDGLAMYPWRSMVFAGPEEARGITSWRLL